MALLEKQLTETTLIKVVFSNQRKKSLPYRKVVLRPVLLNGQYYCQAEYEQEKKVLHENLLPEDYLVLCRKLITDSFKQVNIFSLDGDYQILAAKPEKLRIIKHPPSKTSVDLDHNAVKQYLIPDGIPCDFLIRLGVMDKSGQVIHKHYAKFRQINRFLDIVDDVFPHLKKQPSAEDAGPLRIVDFGCGKAYLSFALYHYLNVIKKQNVVIVGLDLKEDVINFCNQTASELQYEGLQFLKGDIADYHQKNPADMVVTLHACDTATDYALIQAVAWHASVILSVPCCQHELFPQIENKLHKPFLKHGILKERFSALLTDSLRSLKLEAMGYDVSLIEFTSLEHTAKNIMIRAVKTGKSRNEEALAQYEELKVYWHVHPTIDQLM